ncbi:porin [Neomegalonema perideroedes]|uniref:porin n=1 Tax=Neomegalonema perideroedes TaxID=217219 RepID=UPI00036645CC|nr:porin [Neomegalonema perideroedes]
MKKILFGTSALIATTFASVGGASAAGLELGFSGSYTFGAGYLHSKAFTDRTSRGAFIADGELIATARGTLDNGLTFGARLVFPIETASSPSINQNNWTIGGHGDHYTESVGWVEGGFGRLEVGHEDGAHDRSTPGVSGTWFNAANGGGFLFDYFDTTDGGWSFDGRETNDRLKVTYWTPSFSGLKAGVSYVPDATRPTRHTNTALTTSDDAWEFGVRYTGNFNDVTVDVGGGYTIDPAGRNSDDSWAVGGNVGFGQFTVGAAYEDDGNGWDGFGVGGAYNTGPWTFGAAYGRGDSITRSKGDVAQGASLGVDYELGQGVVISAGVEWVDPPNASDRFGAGLVTQLSF